ncbi:MAG: pseudouridine synthase [Thermoanaerobaculia bacterium]
MTRERVQKLLSRAGLASRREAEEWIRQGRVTVNGEVIELGTSADPQRDAIKVDGKRLHLPTAYRYLLLHKPRGTVTTRRDPEGRPTVFDLVPAGERKGLKAVGRLDYHTEGLLLLTDDGDLAQRISHPRYGCTKTYEVKVKGYPPEQAVDRLRRGISIEGRKTALARIRFLRATSKGAAANTWWEVELIEGRTRQVREMFFRIGNPVQKLHRVAIGPLRDPRLPPGGLRLLRDEEIEQLRRREAKSEASGVAAGRTVAARPKKRLTRSPAKRATKGPAASGSRRRERRKR